MRTVFCILALLASSGCSTIHSLSALKSHPKRVTLPIDALADIPNSSLCELQLTIRGTSFSMVRQVETDGETLTLATVTPVSGRLFVIRYDGSELVYEPSHAFDAPIRPERMLRDFFIIYADRLSLREAGIRVATTADGLREVTTENGEQIVVTYSYPKDKWTSEIHYRNELLGYTIAITPIAEEKRD